MPSESRSPIGDGRMGRVRPSRRVRPRRRGRADRWLLVAALALTCVAAGEPTGGTAPRIASRSGSGVATAGHPASAAPRTIPPESKSPVVDTTLADTILAAKQAIAGCQARYAEVGDYTCTFLKRERFDGKLSAQQVMLMKARSRPVSVYFKFQKPNKGREVIYVAGRHKGHVLAHDIGLFKVIAGTMLLDPRGGTAMDGCRHPITEAGIGSLIDTVAMRWDRELTPEESRVTVNPQMTIGDRPCTMIESTHPHREPGFLFYKVRLYIDHELGLPVRFEAYDWPHHPSAPDVLLEEYAYIDLKLNVGLTDHDFDPNNRGYSFGRF
jgi:Protein of unknown function (DUF1571)